MDNEQFQSIVLEQLKTLTDGQKMLEQGQKEIRQDVREIKNELEYIWDDIKKIDNRLSTQEEEVVILNRLK